MSGKIEGKEYDKQFMNLLHHYDLSAKSMDNFAGLESFMEMYCLGHCQSAKSLIGARKSNYRGEETDRNLAQRVFEITTKFI